MKLAAYLGAILVGAAMVANAAPAMGQQYPTIVGEWYPEATPEDCGTPRATRIGPMHYVEDELSCQFTDVARDGWHVTWNGQCSDGNESSPVRVEAIEDNGRLTVLINGNPGWTALRRCNAPATPVSLVAPASVDRVALTYTAHRGDSAIAKRYWPDAVETISSVDGVDELGDRLTVYVAEFGEYQMISAVSMFNCGTGRFCPVKLIKNDVELEYLNVCSERDEHFLAADGSRFIACGDEFAGRDNTSFLR